ncbi:hypothetical protein EPUL_005998 [Erysiphe pulchra]|uniref:Uncharacterized protein n=1 Tax=Erysiphe pulchra TaxID=225359 RepID=A0A2S4PL05_9PEZI|nr:hypothetical protein EPUL_005998 [Erysiphe pulchra]
MAPIRRYVRITKYSVLECRIFLDNPTLGESWLLNPRTEVLSRVMKSVFPLITPKLREEYERNDFEVTVFLTDSRSRHSLLTKQRNFYNPNKKEIKSNSTKLLGTTTDDGVTDNLNEAVITIEEEECSESEICLHDLPEADRNSSSKSIDEFAGVNSGQQRKSKRTRDARSIGSASSDVEPSSKRLKDQDSFGSREEPEEKKMAIRTTYEGFTIYGRVLCLIVRRRDSSGKTSTKQVNQATMENWISSTQPSFENEELSK